MSKQLIQQIQSQQQPQNEEKTLVYVLVKKPDHEAELQELLAARQQQPVTPPSKPEVYFIKYKAQKEQQQSQFIPEQQQQFVPAAQPAFEPLPLQAPQPPSDVSGAALESGDASLLSFGSSGQTVSDASGPSLISAPSAVSISSSVDSSDSNVLNLGNTEAISSIIQPRTPGPEYLPPAKRRSDAMRTEQK